MDWLFAHQGHLFGILVGSLALDILLSSFNGCWYYVTGPVAVRKRRGGGNGPVSLPEPATLEQRVKGIEVAKRNETVYTFRQRGRRGHSAALLLGVIVFDPPGSRFEVQGRMGIFSILFIASFVLVFVVSGGWRDLQGVIVASTMLIILVAFAVRDAMVCKRVANGVSALWP